MLFQTLFHALSHITLIINPYKVGTLIIPILYTTNVRFREAKQLAKQTSIILLPHFPIFVGMGQEYKWKHT